jgi:hypothetical protein
MRVLLISTLLLSLVPGLALAQSDLPPAVTRGLEAVRAGHVDSALTIWARDLGEEGQAQMAASTPILVRFCSSPNGYDLLRSVELSAHLRRLYFLIRCSAQPVYVMLVLYQGSSDWIIATLNWNTDPDRVLPSTLFGAQRP